MSKLKPLPKVKVYEAFTALVSNRIEIISNTDVELITKVFSSSRDKFYTVKFDKVGKQIGSDDNSAYFQNTASYPMLASLMKIGIIDFNLKIAELFRDIEWKKINTKFKNDYQKAVDFVIAEMKLDSDLVSKIQDEVENIMTKFTKYLNL